MNRMVSSHSFFASKIEIKLRNRERSRKKRTWLKRRKQKQKRQKKNKNKKNYHKKNIYSVIIHTNKKHFDSYLFYHPNIRCELNKAVVKKLGNVNWLNLNFSLSSSKRIHTNTSDVALCPHVESKDNWYLLRRKSLPSYFSLILWYTVNLLTWKFWHIGHHANQWFFK